MFCYSNSSHLMKTETIRLNRLLKYEKKCDKTNLNMHIRYIHINKLNYIKSTRLQKN